MAVIDASKIPSAADIISLHVKMNEKAVKKARFQADRFNRPAIYEIGGRKFAAPSDNNPPAIEEWAWECVGTYRNRKVYQAA